MSVLHVETEAVTEWRVLSRALPCDDPDEEDAIGYRLEELWWDATEEERDAMRAYSAFLNAERNRALQSPSPS